MTGSALKSTLAISGGSASGGSALTTRATRSRTSFAASSTERSGANSRLMFERPSMLCEVILVTPSSPATRSSITCVIFVSTTSAAAPRYVVSIETTGDSTSGSSRTGRRV